MMMNKYFPDEVITKNDLYFLCYMIERIARRLHQKNKYIVNSIGYENWIHLISVADVLHCENPLKVEDTWIEEYGLQEGNYDITKVNPEFAERIPTPIEMGRVYTRLIEGTMNDEENYVDAMIRVYNNDICEIIDNYNCSAYYEPSYVIIRAYYDGGF